MYIFVFAFSFLFSSDQFHLKWNGLDIDLSLCDAIKVATDDIKCCPKEVFERFPFPSQQTKKKQYLKKLFNPHFDYSDAETQLLVNLAVDRKALGFDQEIFLDPLLKAAIKKGLLTFSSMTFVLNDDNNKRRVEEYVKNTRNYFNVSSDCFEYLKTDMPNRLPDYFESICKDKIIESKPEWNELIAYDPKTFFTCLIQANADYLELNGLAPDALTQFFEQYKLLNQNHNLNLKRLTILNSSINETVFELQKMFKAITLRNCFNLSLGKTGAQKNNIIETYVFKKYFNNRSKENYFENCKLDESSFQACQDISHKISMIHCLNQLGLLSSLFWSIFDICQTIRSSEKVLRTVHLVFSLIMGGLLFSHGFDSSFLYFAAIRIAYDLVPLVLKENCIFPFRLLSGIITIGILISNLFCEYMNSRDKMGWLMENEFGLCTKYAFLDRLCKLYFGCGDPYNKR